MFTTNTVTKPTNSFSDKFGLTTPVPVLKQVYEQAPNDLQVSLFLVSPQNQVDIYRRQHTYNFSPNFMESISDIVSDTCAGRSHANVFNDPNSIDAVVPSLNTTRIKTSDLSDAWTFFLIVHVPSFIGGSTINDNHEKYYIASGYCRNEPMNINSGALNHDCLFEFTHFTCMECTYINGSQGTSKIIRTIEDRDIIDQYYLHTLSGNSDADMYILKPETVASTITPVSYDRDSSSCDIAPKNLFNSRNAPTIEGRKSKVSASFPSYLNIPIRHTDTVVKDFVNASIRENESIRGDFYDSGLPDTSFETSPMSIMDSISKRANEIWGANILPKNIELNRPQFFSTLLKTYPEMNITPIVLNPNPSYDRMDGDDAGGNTLHHVCQTMIANSIAPILASKQISEVAFSYVSDEPANIEHFIPHYESPMEAIGNQIIYGKFDIQKYIISIIPKDDQTLGEAWEYACRQMRCEVFDIVKHMIGDFMVFVSCNISGNTVVRLIERMPEQRVRHLCNPRAPVYFESNNLLGGLNNPLLGNLQTAQNNATNLYGVADHLSDYNHIATTY